MNTKIYIFTHKEYEMPKDSMYVPLFVGAAGHANHPYKGDDTGDNISLLNKYYSELTGMYWIYKNDLESEIIGNAHYRRYLINPQTKRAFSQAELIDILNTNKTADIICTKKVLLNNSYRDGFKANHNIEALDMTGVVIKDLYPEYYDDFINLVNLNRTYFGNLFITSGKIYKDYCQWLFNIFFELQKRINLETDEDDYHKRVLGFISEFLQYVYIYHNNLSVLECMVGMIGEKAEVSETKDKLSEFFYKRDYYGAREFFYDTLKKRPDILMEASDITGELHICMQIIATACLEHENGLDTILDRINDINELIIIFTQLNNMVTQRIADNIIIKELNISILMLEISKRVVEAAKEHEV